MISQENVLLFLLLLLQIVFAKKDIKLDDFLNVEEQKLKKDGFDCSERQLTEQNIHSLRLQHQDDDTVILCIIKFLQLNPKHGFIWTALGSAFDRRGKKFSSQASACFKQAAKISGKFPTFIEDWFYIGPFVIGKTEFDGDPIEAFGGISNISRFRMDDLISYPSELSPLGLVKWTKIQQTAEDHGVRIKPNINWNDLVSSLGSMAITEWQGWVVGEAAINQDEVTLLVQCFGVSTVFIDGIPVTGDVYHREKFHSVVSLTRGMHKVRIKLRAKVQAVFQCALTIPPKAGFEVLAPNFQPDFYDGFIFSPLFYIPIANYKSDKWLKITKVSLSGQTKGESLQASIVSNRFSIAPGQTSPVIIRLSSSSARISKYCEDIGINFIFKTSEGQGTLPLTLRCRKKGESFLFTFLDHDGSVQHAAAVEPIGSCVEKKCPTLLTLHGTTVPPQNQADSYKRMVGGEFKFGVQGMWLVAPTRHGAHNWEGPGALTAMTALEALTNLTQQLPFIQNAADAQHVLFEGHSMGGHGAWHLATHFPDRAIGLAALAGWIKKEEYGDSNLFFKHDIATSHTDVSVKATMEACIGENDADRHVSNLWKIPVLCRVGGNDRTVHPFFSRRMYRLLQEEHSQVIFTELDGKEHWWWDTWETNDGGVVNDKQMRNFAAECLSSFIAEKTATAETDTCTTQDCDGTMNEKENMWQKHTAITELVTINPALGEGLRGVRIIQQSIPFRASKIKINITEDAAYLSTINVRGFTLSEPPTRPVHWQQKKITIDGKFSFSKEDTERVLRSDAAHFCKSAGTWDICMEDIHQENRRGPDSLGPARRIAEKEFIIILGTQSTQHVTHLLQSYAVYLANLFFLTSDALAPIVKDTDITAKEMENTNVILIGGSRENRFTSSFLSKIPVEVDENLIHLGDCSFSDMRTGLMALAPNGAKSLALILLGTTSEGMADVISLATPTIPPMTRSPFSNLLPDFIITGENYRRQGPGGFLCAGFWGNHWELRQDLISCACGRQ